MFHRPGRKPAWHLKWRSLATVQPPSQLLHVAPVNASAVVTLCASKANSVHSKWTCGYTPVHVLKVLRPLRKTDFLKVVHSHGIHMAVVGSKEDFHCPMWVVLNIRGNLWFMNLDFIFSRLWRDLTIEKKRIHLNKIHVFQCTCYQSNYYMISLF